MFDFDDIFTVYSQMNMAYNHIKILELACWMTAQMEVKSGAHSKKMTWPVLLIRSSKKF